MRTPFSQCLVAILAALLIMPAAAGATTFSGAGANAAAIQGTVDAFRAALGGVDNGNAAGPLDTGRREINWDGGGATARNTTVAKDHLSRTHRGSHSSLRRFTQAFPSPGHRIPGSANQPDLSDTFRTLVVRSLSYATDSNITEELSFPRYWARPVPQPYRLWRGLHRCRSGEHDLNRVFQFERRIAREILRSHREQWTLLPWRAVH